MNARGIPPDTYQELATLFCLGGGGGRIPRSPPGQGVGTRVLSWLGIGVPPLGTWVPLPETGVLPPGIGVPPPGLGYPPQLGHPQKGPGTSHGGTPRKDMQGSHISGLTKFHDISMSFFKKIPGIFSEYF